MKTKNFWLIVFTAALVCAAGVVWAASPHFLDNKTTLTINPNGSLTVKFKEAGLGDTETTYLFSAQATVTCNCVTRSGQCPEAANKVTSTVDVSDTARFDPKNGTVSATLTLDVPGCGPSAPPTCGGGQHLVLSAINWEFISLRDITNGIDATLPFTEAEQTFFDCP